MQTENLAAMLNRMPVVGTLGLIVETAGDGAARLRLPFRKDLSFDGASFQGGIVGALADFAGVGAAATLCRADELVATTGYYVHLISPATGAALIAEGRVSARKGATAASQVEIFVQAKGNTKIAVDPCAIASTSCRYLLRTPRPD